MKGFRSSRRYLKGVLALLFCWSVATTSAEAIDFMPVNDVRTGMEGHADTVVSGDTISSFNVKVLGVMRDRGPSGDLILAKFSGPVIDETGGIVHGMSGSPVYIDGKLVGAVAYGWGFADGTIGMITPIEDMVKLWNIPYEKNLANPWRDDKLIPLGTPLMAMGFDSDSLAYMKSKLPQYGYSTYDTAAADGDNVARPLKAGGSVAALLVDGDLKLGAIGTVTYVDGQHIVAFGHPFLKRGSMDYFMHNAYIFTVVKSLDSGFKMGSMGAEIGTVTEDRGAGIAGVSGQIAHGIPLRIAIRDLDTGKERLAGVKLVEAGEMTPTLAATSFYNFLNKTLDRTGEGTATVHITITPRDNTIKPLSRTNMFYSADNVSLKSVDEIYNIIDVLMNNRFKDYEIADLQITADVTKKPETAHILDATLTPGVAAPGDTIVVDVRLQPFRGDTITKEVFYTVPKDQPLGKVTLEVRGGGVVPLPYLIEKQKYNLTDEIIRRLKTYKDFDEFYKDLRNTDTNNQIVVEILQNGVSMVDTNDDSVSTPKVDPEVTAPIPGGVDKPKTKGATDVTNPEDNKQPQESKVDTNYIIRGDGQFVLDIVSPADRDKAIAKMQREHAKALKEKAKQDAEKAAADKKDASKDSTTTTDGTAKDGNSANKDANGSKSSDTKDGATKSGDKASNDSQFKDKAPSANKPADKAPSDSQSKDKAPSNTKPTDKAPSTTKSSDVSADVAALYDYTSPVKVVRE